MNNREIEGKIKNAVEKSTPNVWDRVQHDINNGKGEVITMSDKKRKGKILGYISSIAAALVLISAAVFGITNYNKADLKPVGAVYLEVNPQIELSLNTYNVVLEVTPKNEDGKKVLGTMELKNSQLEVALNAILGSMVKNGYLTKEANSVLISVEHESRVKANYLNNEVLRSVKNNDFTFATVVQTVENTSDLKTKAQNLNITSGKAEFIRIIKEKGVKASEEDLSKLSVHDLNLIFQSHIVNGETKEGTEYKGNAAESKYIGAKKAKEIALNSAKADEKNIRDFEVDLDYEKGRMVYEVEFDVANTEYDYEIDALSGAIIASNQKGKNQNPGTNTVSSKPDTASNSSVTTSVVSPSSQTNSGSKIDAVVAPEDVLGIVTKHLAALGGPSDTLLDVDIELDKDDKIPHYDVDFKYGKYEYEYEINALTGEVIKWDKELDD